MPNRQKILFICLIWTVTILPIIDHNNTDETPWRPNYRKWDITKKGDGTTSSSMSLSSIGTGAGAPLHTHEADELIVVLKGTLEVVIDGETYFVGADHTIVVPPNVPHGFTNKEASEAQILGFFPIQDPFNHTKYLDGVAPSGHEVDEEGRSRSV